MKNEPTFDELVNEVTSAEAQKEISNITFSAAPDPFANMTDFEKLERMAEEETPRPPDDNENRFGFSPLFDIHVAKKNANNNYGNFGKFDFLPRLALIPFYDTVFSIPAEIKGRTVVGESIDDILSENTGDFDLSEAESAISGGFNRIRKSAKQLAELFLHDHAPKGAGIFSKLQNLKYAHAKRIYSTVLPFEDKAYWIETFGEARCKVRTLLGYRLDENPFLDVVMDYLTYKAIDRIEQSKLDRADLERAFATHEEMIAYCETAVINAKQQLDEKEQEIRDGKTRGGYDRPDRLVVGSPKPPDLVRLAHLNRVPMDDRATADIMTMGEMIGNRMTQNQAQAAAVAAPGGMNIDEIVNQVKNQLRNDPTFIAEVEKDVLTKAGLLT